MKKVTSLVLAFVASSCAWASWETSSEHDLYAVAFDGYAPGETLTDKGAKGGSWGVPPVKEGASAVAEQAGGKKYMGCSAQPGELVFTPEQLGLDGAKAFSFSFRTSAYSELPALVPSVDKAAFAVYDHDDVIRFMGWSATGWQDLHLASGAVSPSLDAWYDVSIWLVPGLEGKPRVQYRLKVGSAYEPLVTQAGSEWLDAGNPTGDPVIREVEVLGECGVERFSGKELPTPGVSTHFR